MGERKKQRGQLRKLKKVCEFIGQFEPFTRTEDDEVYESELWFYGEEICGSY